MSSSLLVVVVVVVVVAVVLLLLLLLSSSSSLDNVPAATLRYKLQIHFAISPTHGILITGQPVPALTLKRRVPGRVATGDSGKIILTGKVGFEPRSFALEGNA